MIGTVGTDFYVVFIQVGMSCRSIAMTGLWIGVADKSVTLLTTMGVSLQLVTRLPSTLMCVQLLTLFLPCGTGLELPGGGGPHS